MRAGPCKQAGVVDIEQPRSRPSSLLPCIWLDLSLIPSPPGQRDARPPAQADFELAQGEHLGAVSRR
jgi:hypothetical protein